MPRKRMLDPAIWEDPDFGSLSHASKVLFIGLISNADDDGRGIADPRYLRKTIFGFDEDLTSQDVDDMMGNLSEEIRSLILYEVEARTYYALLNWSRYQKISHPRPGIIPPPPGTHVEESSDDAGKIFRKWEDAHGAITGAVAQEFGAMIEEWDAHLLDLPEDHINQKVNGIDATFEALRVGIGAKTRPSINYVWGIMKNWMAEGYKSKPTNGKDKKQVDPGYSKEELKQAKAKAKGTKK